MEIFILRVRYTEPTQKILEDYYGFKKYNKFKFYDRKVTLFRFESKIFFKHEIHIIEDKDSAVEEMALEEYITLLFGVKDIEDLKELQEKNRKKKTIFNSGIKK